MKKPEERRVQACCWIIGEQREKSLLTFLIFCRPSFEKRSTFVKVVSTYNCGNTVPTYGLLPPVWPLRALDSPRAKPRLVWFVWPLLLLASKAAAAVLCTRYNTPRQTHKVKTPQANSVNQRKKKKGFWREKCGGKRLRSKQKLCFGFFGEKNFMSQGTALEENLTKKK